VAAGAAFAGTGVLTNFVDGGKGKAGDGLNQMLFGHAEAAADDVGNAVLARLWGSGFHPVTVSSVIETQS
jgi:hypothetical protein